MKFQAGDRVQHFTEEHYVGHVKRTRIELSEPEYGIAWDWWGKSLFGWYRESHLRLVPALKQLAEAAE